MSSRLSLFADSVARLARPVRELVHVEDLEALAAEMFAVRQAEAAIVARLALEKLNA